MSYLTVTKEFQWNSHLPNILGRLANMPFGAKHTEGDLRSRRALLSMSVARFEYFLTVPQRRFIYFASRTQEMTV